MMGNYEQLKAAVAAIIRDNGQEEITGDILQGVLLGIINSVGSGATFAGVATPSTNPGTPDPNVFYIAGQAGTYTNFNLTITDGLWVFENKNGTWVGTSLDVSVLFATGEDVSQTNIASSIAGAGSGYLPTFGVVQEMLNGVVGTVNRSALDTATTAGLYRVMASSAVAGYLFVTVSQSTRYRVQFLTSDITAFTDGGTESDYKGHILTRSYNDSDNTAAVCPLHTWSAWQEYGGDAENIKYGNESVADALNDRFTKADVNTMLNELFSELAARDSALQAMMDYYVCDTVAGTAAKTITAPGYVLTRGGCIRIKMTNANTADNVTLNINNTGAKALYYDGAQASATNTWEAGEVLEVYYDGTQYQCASGGFPVEVMTEDNADLDISDENGNVLVRFENGHIRTKYFDSSNINLDQDFSLSNYDNGDFGISDQLGYVLLSLANGNISVKNFTSAPLKGKKVSFLGDSITTYANYPGSNNPFYTGSNAGVTSVNQTWWKSLCDRQGATVNRIYAYGGGDLINRLCLQYNNLYSNGTSGNAPDVVFILAGINDWYRNKTLGTIADAENSNTTFYAAYKYLLKNLKETYPNAQIIGLTMLNSMIYDTTVPYLNMNNVSIRDFCKAVVECCDYYSVPSIDLNKIVNINGGNYTELLADYTHPNITGIGMMTKAIINNIHNVIYY